MTDLVDDQRDEKLGTARKEMKQGGAREEEDWSVHTISYREVGLWVDGLGCGLECKKDYVELYTAV